MTQVVELAAYVPEHVVNQSANWFDSNPPKTTTTNADIRTWLMSAPGHYDAGTDTAATAVGQNLAASQYGFDGELYEIICGLALEALNVMAGMSEPQVAYVHPTRLRRTPGAPFPARSITPEGIWPCVALRSDDEFTWFYVCNQTYAPGGITPAQVLFGRARALRGVCLPNGTPGLGFFRHRT